MTNRVTSGRVLASLVAAFALAATFLTLGAAPASAGHSQLLSTSPVDGSVLAAPPAEVVFTFDAPLLPDTPTVSINDADGQVVSSIHPAPDGDSVSIPWPEGTAPGDYQVAFRVVCADGQPLIGAITLTITGSADAVAASPSTSAAPATTTSPATSATASAASSAPTPAKGLPIAALLAVAAGIAVIAVVAVVISGRRRRTSAGATGAGSLH